MKLMNSETHSCIVSLASLAILPLAGNAFFMILLMLAIGKYRSCSRTPDERGLCSPPLSWLPPAGLVGASAISGKKKKTLDHCIHRVKNINTATHVINNLYIRITHTYVSCMYKYSEDNEWWKLKP
jgi:hypothetical protein